MRLQTVSFSKSEKEAEGLKKQGNDHFRRKELHKALHCYAEAAFTSPWPGQERQRILSHLLGCLEPSKRHVATSLFSSTQKTHELQNSLLALCIGNRSAVLYEMNRPQECLADIELALSLGFPAVSQYKLYRRQGLCLAQLGDRAGALRVLEASEETLSANRSACTKEKEDQLTAEFKIHRKKVESLLQEHEQSQLSEGRRQGAVHDAARQHHQKSMRETKAECGHVSRAITCDYSPSKGRFIRAKRDIAAGEVVVSERASAAVLSSGLYLTHCSHCFHQTSSLIPCCWCASDGYCSSECREEAWVGYHWIECPVSDLWGKADWMMKVALRMVLSAPATVLKEVLSKGLCEASAIADSSRHNSTQPYTALLSLASHKDRFLDTQQAAMFSKMAETLMEYFGNTIAAYLSSQTTEHHNRVTLEGIKSLFLHHLLQLRCNSHRVTSVLETGEAAADDGVVQSSHEATLGSAVFPTASLFNHSCWPNIIFRFQGSTVEAVATRPIATGEEACNCYGPQLGRMKRAERVAELQRKYFFHCSCPACAGSDASLEYRESVMDAYLCPACSGAVSEGQWQCRDCQMTLETSDVERIQELKGETERMFSTANVGGEMDLPLLLKCHSLQSRVLHCHNMMLARTCDALAQAHACTGVFGKAAKFCAASCRAVEAVHGSHSIELATELHKLAQLLFNSGQFGRAVEVVEKALPLMSMYHSPGHPDITELQQMKNLLRP